MAERSKDIDQEYIDYVDNKLFQLKSRIKTLKEEVNTEFMSFINSVLQQQNKILCEIDSKFDDVMIQATDQKVKIARLAGEKSQVSKPYNPLDRLELKKVQNEMQQLKNENVYIPEITINWQREAFKSALEDIAKIEKKEHPFTYLNHIKYSLHQFETSALCNSKTFEIDWPSGNVYFLNNFEDKHKFDFSITVFDRISAPKQSNLCKLERKFSPIGMCFYEEHIFVTATGKSAKNQMASIPREEQINTIEFKECILKIEKSSGMIQEAVEAKGTKEIGQIEFEPKDQLFYVIDHATSFMNVWDSELKLTRQFQMKQRTKGWLSAAPKIEHFQISKDDIFIVYDKKPCLEIYNLSGVLIRQLFDTFPEKYTIDPMQNIIGIDSKSNSIHIWDPMAKEIVKISGKLDVVNLQFKTIGIKFDTLTGRIVFCGISSAKDSHKLAFAYL